MFAARCRRALVAAFVIGATTAGAAVTTAAPAGAATVQIHFDGFCIGMELHIPSVGFGTGETTDGVMNGCQHNPVYGLNQPNKRGLTGVKKGTEFLTVQGFPDGSWIMQLNHDHTWVLYQTGDGIRVGNSGTWSLGPPPASARALPSMFSRASAPRKHPNRAGARPAKVYEITFDGSCRGMRIYNPSHGLGSKGTVDGDILQANCITRDWPMIGFSATIGGVKKTVLASFTTDDRGDHWYTYVIHPDHSWVLVGTDGSKFVIYQTGTWSPGYAS